MSRGLQKRFTRVIILESQIIQIYEKDIFNDRTDEPLLDDRMGAETSHYPTAVPEWTRLRRYGAVGLSVYWRPE